MKCYAIETQTGGKLSSVASLRQESIKITCAPQGQTVFLSYAAYVLLTELFSSNCVVKYIRNAWIPCA